MVYLLQNRTRFFNSSLIFILNILLIINKSNAIFRYALPLRKNSIVIFKILQIGPCIRVAVGHKDLNHNVRYDPIFGLMTSGIYDRSPIFMNKKTQGQYNVHSYFD